MRIKIIGDNNCARATRHLLRMAGFAVTEFLPAEAITQAPHHGYAITIELAPAAHPPTHSSTPDHSTHGHPASAYEETSAKAKADAGVSSPAFAPKGGAMAGGPASQSMAGDAAGGPASDFGESNGSVGFSLRGVGLPKEKITQAEACATKTSEAPVAQALACAGLIRKLRDGKARRLKPTLLSPTYVLIRWMARWKGLSCATSRSLLPRR